MFEYAGAAGRTRVQRYWDALKEYPSGVLLAAQILGILVFPFTNEGEVGRTIVSIFGLFVLGIAVLAVNRTPSTRIIAYSLGAPVVVLTIAEAFWTDVAWLEFVSNVSHAIFYFYTAISLLRYMFADAWVSRDELLATGATFTVLVWAYAYTYGAVQVILPNSFTVADEVRPLSWFELLFLSTTTLTGTGLSDIAPNTSSISDAEGVNFARSIVMLQMLTGMNYVALVIARLLGLTLIKFRR